jgi:hypothetical protein
VGDQKPWQEDAVNALELAVQEPNKDLGCERAALRLAAVEWLIRTATVADEEKRPSMGPSDVEGDWLPPDLGRTLQSDTLQRPRTMRNGKTATRRNKKYIVIDDALQAISEARPTTQEEIFQSLEGRHVVIPPAEPFTAARGWIAGFRRDAAAARAWLSKRWAELNLPPLPRGPKNPRK